MNVKHFPEWNDEKVDIHNNKGRPFFHVREVWFCVMGANIVTPEVGPPEK